MELARIPYLAHEPGLSAIRHQWWRDSLQRASAGGGGDHPSITLLLAALERRVVELHEIEALIDAFEAEGDTALVSSMPVLTARGEAATARFLSLALRLLGATANEIETIAKPMAAGWAGMALLRSHAARGSDLPRRYGVSPADVARNALAHLDAVPPAPRRLAGATLHGAIARANLASLRRVNHDLAACRWADQGALLPARLYWRVLRGRG